MRYFKQTDFSDRNGRIWFHADKYAGITGSIDLAFDELTLVANAAESGAIGDIDVTFEPLEAVCIGYQGLISDLEATFDPLEFVGSASYEPPVEQVTGAIVCDFTELELDMGSGRGMLCTFEPPQIIINEVINMATMDCSFKELDVFIYGENTFVYLQQELEKMECVMYVGNTVFCEFEEPTITVDGSISIQGSIVCRALRPTFLARGGPPPGIDVEMEELTFSADADSSIVASLAGTIRIPRLEMNALSSITASLNARMNLMSAQFTEGPIGPVASLSATFIPFTGTFQAAPPDIWAELTVTALVMQLRARMLVDGPNGIDIEFPVPEIELGDIVGGGGGLGEVGAECDLADTLIYGGE